MADLAIPERLAASAVAWTGGAGRDWLEELPALVGEVATAWDLELAAPFEPGGNISWVAPARRAGAARFDLVLKVQLPHPESDPEALALEAWAGRGAVRLEAHDPERRALLLERCRPGAPVLHQLGPGPALEAGAGIIGALHSVPAPAGIPSLAVVLSAWADELEARRPLVPELDEGLWRLAIATMRERPASARPSVLLHGDLNPTNVLSSERGWLAIDPKPMAGDPAYDAARLVVQAPPTEGTDPIEVIGRRILQMGDRLGVEPTAVAAWCLVAMVEGGAWHIAVGEEAEGRRLLGLLDRVTPHLG